MESLIRAIKTAGSQVLLAERVNRLLPEEEHIWQSAISNWLQRGQIPAEKVIPVARAAEFQVTPHELRPDLYPHPSDGLPEGMKERAA